MSAPVSGKVDQNAKPSTILWDPVHSTTFAAEGDSVLGVPYMQIVDNSGTPIVSFGGGTQYTDGGSTVTHPIGTMPIYDNAGTISKVSVANGLPIQPATGSTFTVDTELPAAAAAADGASNPTAPFAQTANAVFNGTTWDRLKSIINATNSTGTGIAAVGLTAQLDDTSPTSITENQFGNLRITGKRAIHTAPKPDTAQTTNGKVISAASTNATSVAASASTIKFLTASNINASPRYLKIYNKASSPTVGTDTPVWTFIIPGNTSGAGTNLPLPDGGLYLSTGFALAITGGATDADTTAVSANENIVNYSYEAIA